MRKRLASTTWLLATGLAILLISTSANAAVTLTFGAGSAVTIADRQATFDSITAPGIDLSNYTEDSLKITVPNVSYVGFDPFNDGSSTMFHYGSSGGNNYVTITGTDSATFTGLELKIGDGFFASNGSTLFAWATYLGGSLTGSGNSILAPRGSVVGWSDPTGFDELRIGGASDTLASYNLGDFQAIALDNVRVQIGTAAVPEPLSFAVWSAVIGVACVYAYGRQVIANRVRES